MKKKEKIKRGAPSKVNFSLRSQPIRRQRQVSGGPPPGIGTVDLLLKPKHESYTLTRVTFVHKHTHIQSGLGEIKTASQQPAGTQIKVSEVRGGAVPTPGGPQRDAPFFHL